MGIAERREREKEALRTRIVEAARDIISESGLDAVSMRSIAERIEYSPATIYLYFRDKNQLLGEVISAGFELMRQYIEKELAVVEGRGNPAEQHKALGRAYARFGLENTAYFRVMFELPSIAQTVSVEECCAGPGSNESGRRLLEDAVQRAIDEGLYGIEDAKTGAVVAWSLVHGLTSLYLSGHIAPAVGSHEAFMDLVEVAMNFLGSGLIRRETTFGETP